MESVENALGGYPCRFMRVRSADMGVMDISYLFMFGIL